MAFNCLNFLESKVAFKVLVSTANLHPYDVVKNVKLPKNIVTPTTKVRW